MNAREPIDRERGTDIALAVAATFAQYCDACDARAEFVIDARAAGHSYRAIGHALAITAQRVHQIATTNN